VPRTPELDEDVMRIATTVAALLFVLQACSSTKSTESPYAQPNLLMGSEITKRIEQVPYQHRDELLQNLVWLVQQGEQAIPATLDGLRSQEPKVRSSCAWVLGRLHDRRTIPDLQAAMKDNEIGVRLEVARSLVSMGDLAQCPVLIEGLDSDKKEVRYMCHETMKTATGRDFGYDHLNANETEMRLSVLRWRQWWSEYSGDARFAQSYQNQYHLDPAAAPSGETKPTDGQTPQDQEPQTQGNGTQGSGTQGNGTQGNGTQGNGTQGNGTQGNGKTGGSSSTNGTGGNSGNSSSTTGTDNGTTGSKTSGSGPTTGSTTNSTESTGTTNKTGSGSSSTTNGAGTGNTTGTNGTSGTNGTNGTTGTNGTSGTTGTNGTTGTPNNSRPNGG
jgi:hypothetical protein